MIEHPKTPSIELRKQQKEKENKIKEDMQHQLVKVDENGDQL